MESFLGDLEILKEIIDIFRNVDLLLNSQREIISYIENTKPLPDYILKNQKQYQSDEYNGQILYYSLYSIVLQVYELLDKKDILLLRTYTSYVNEIVENMQQKGEIFIISDKKTEIDYCRRLRNSIAHHKYHVSNCVFVLMDENPKQESDFFVLKISAPYLIKFINKLIQFSERINEMFSIHKNYYNDSCKKCKNPLNHHEPDSSEIGNNPVNDKKEVIKQESDDDIIQQFIQSDLDFCRNQNRNTEVFKRYNEFRKTKDLEIITDHQKLGDQLCKHFEKEEGTKLYKLKPK